MNLQKLLSHREGHRSVIKRNLEKINDAKENGRLSEFNAILDMLEAKVKTLDSLNEKILSQTDVEGIEQEIFKTDEYSFELEMQLRDLREYRHQMGPSTLSPRRPQDISVDPPRPQDIGVDQQQTTSGENIRASAQTVSNVSFTSSNSAQFHKLPKLSLPTFDGNILQWQTFWDTFESTVHINANLTDVQRFSYLKNQLEGEALRTIEGFALTNSNYACAISLLKERFGQEHKITHATMQALLGLPAPNNSLYSLKNFHDKLESYIRSLESLGQYQETYGNLLVPIVIDKLPAEIRRNMAREHGNRNWQLIELRQAIRRELDIMEAGDTANLHPDIRDYSTTASFLTKTKPKDLNPTPNHSNLRKPTRDSALVRCAFCEGDHRASDCERYADNASRMHTVKEKKLCFNCLKPHRVSNCRSSGRCQNCGRRHHTSICNTTAKSVQQQQQPPKTSLRSEAAVFHSSSRPLNFGVLLKTATATVTSGNVFAEANVLLDEGAQRSFITEELANELQLPRKDRETIQLSAFGDQCNKVMHLDTATVTLVTEDQDLIPIHVLIVPTIATPMHNRLIRQVSTYTYLQGLKLAHHVTGEAVFTISMLNGADYYWKIVEDHVVRGDGPTAVKSRLGYLLSGPVVDNTSDVTDHVMNVNISSRTADELSLERFWKLESMGIVDQVQDSTAVDYLQLYKETAISFEDGRYVAKLPWKQEHPTLPSNYTVTYRRTENTIRRLSQEPKMLQLYGKIIADQERNGFIEKVNDVTNTQTRVHYIPHHPVRKQSSTTPIRIVYDCSCRQSRDHASLNDCLESTPPVLNDITSILLRFRMHRFAVTADIEKAFLQIGLHEEDRDVTRFLWLSDPNDPQSPLMTYRSVLFGATCSPFILGATISKHLENNPDVKASKIIEQDLYVDNVLSSFRDENGLLQYYKESRQLISGAGMNLRSWSSNSQILRQLAADDNVLNTDEICKVLDRT